MAMGATHHSSGCKPSTWRSGGSGRRRSGAPTPPDPGRGRPGGSVPGGRGGGGRRDRNGGREPGAEARAKRLAGPRSPPGPRSASLTLIGNLQANAQARARALRLIAALDSWPLAESMSERLAAAGRRLPVLMRSRPRRKRPNTVFFGRWIWSLDRSPARLDVNSLITPRRTRSPCLSGAGRSARRACRIRFRSSTCRWG